MNAPASLGPSAVQPLAQRIIQNTEQVIVGRRRELELVLAGLLCQGHLLIEDVPGVGKTVLSRSLARCLGCTFSRIQFTPDLLPSDITGTSVFNPQTRAFEFRPGPLMAQVILADEINRATPKTQSALLEAMEERQITIDGVSHALPRPFIVIATQNPIEYEGTFPLPEAQLDRFLLRIRLGYLSKDEEIDMAERQQFDHPLATLAAVVGQEELTAMQNAVRHVFVSPAVKRYIVDLTSPRAISIRCTSVRAREGLSGCIGEARPWRPCAVAITCSPTMSRRWPNRFWRTASSSIRRRA